MSIYKMTPEKFAQFIKDTEAKTVENFPAPNNVRVLATDGGTVVVLDNGESGMTVIGDSVGVYWGPEAPDYLS